MSSSANPQHEPTMEEILASIRKIISEDQPDGAKPAEPTPVRAAAAEAQHLETDVLELTEEVRDEEVAVEKHAPEVQPPIEDDIAFENDVAEPKAVADMDTDDLISDSARSAVSRAIAKLDTAAPKPAPQSSGGALDGLFTKAIQDAFSPTLQEWVDGHHAQIMDSLKPVIREWMDANLPSLIEAAVTREISRAAAERPRRR